MAKDLNKVQIIGRLGKDVETRFTPSGAPVANFTVAAGRQWKEQSGEQREETEWFSIVAWNKLAEICDQYLTKGTRVYIEGRLQTRSWDDDNGQKHFRTEVVANDMIILDKAKGNDNGGDFDDAVNAQDTARATQAAPRQSNNGGNRQQGQGQRANQAGGQFLNNQHQARGNNAPARPTNRNQPVQDDGDLPF